MEPARVLFLVSTLSFGGAEKHTVTLANRLDRSRFRCSVSYLKPDHSLLPQLDCERLDAVVSLNVQKRVDHSAVVQLTELLDHLAIDVIVCVNEYPTIYALLAARRAKRPPKLVDIFHTTLFGTFKAKLQMWIYRRTFRQFDLLIYVSRNQQAYWRRKGLRARRDAVILNGIDCDHFRDVYSAADKTAVRARYGFTDSDYLVGICAALRPEKAHGDLIQAIALLHARGIAARCLIIGDGPRRAQIEAQIAECGLSHSIVITGFQADVRPFIACCDVVVLVSHAVETFSIAALEAMAMGKPVILSRIGGADEQVIAGETGGLFEPGDLDSLASLLADTSKSDVSRRMGENAARSVRAKFREALMLESYADSLAAVTSDHPESAGPAADV
jgi:glycosyltransferase involved in cell wall biosynthesis